MFKLVLNRLWGNNVFFGSGFDIEVFFLFMNTISNLLFFYCSLINRIIFFFFFTYILV